MPSRLPIGEPEHKAEAGFVTWRLGNEDSRTFMAVVSSLMTSDLLWFKERQSSSAPSSTDHSINSVYVEAKDMCADITYMQYEQGGNVCGIYYCGFKIIHEI